MSPPNAPRLIAYDLGPPMQRIVPAAARRTWMDASPQAFANRCLPLTIANAHGWFILNEVDISASWNGGPSPGDVKVWSDVSGPPESHGLTPIAHFGAGTLTWHVNALFSTDPGISLWVGGPPNLVKDGIMPLTGLVETDWTATTFTMNWRFTRPGHEVRFTRGEPFCHIFPINRATVALAEPEIRPIAERPDLAARYNAWSGSRNSFQRGLRVPGSGEAERGWQRHYHSGLNPDGAPGCPHMGSAQHQTRVRSAPFKDMRAKPPVPVAAIDAQIDDGE